MRSLAWHPKVVTDVGLSSNSCVSDALLASRIGLKVRRDNTVDELESAFPEGGRVIYFAFVGFLFACQWVAHVVI